MMTRLRQASGVEGVGLHDLRRTYRSALADLGVREEIAEAMIAHRRSDLVSRYNRAELWDQRREAAEKLDVMARERHFAHRGRRGRQRRADFTPGEARCRPSAVGQRDTLTRAGKTGRGRPRAGAMIERDDPVDDLVPVDDPRVTAFRKLLYDADEWRSAGAGRNDRKAAYDEAGVLVGRLRDLMIETPFLDVMRDRMAMEWETTPVNPEWPQEAADQRRTLMATKRAVVDLGAAFLGPGSTPSPATSSCGPRARHRLSTTKSRAPRSTVTTRLLWTPQSSSPFASRTTMLDSMDQTGEPSTPKFIPASAMTRETLGMRW